MISLKRKQSGFTIVELLIVIVVIGILAALVITTFAGVQKKARNTERETDIKAIHGQLEAYYAQEGKYPTLANLNDATFRSDNLKGLDEGALQDPQGDTAALTATAATGVSYGYAATPANCDNGAGGDCTGYTLTANKEGEAAFTKDALN